MNKNEEILEKYFLREIRVDNKVEDLVGWWIIGRVKIPEICSKDMGILKKFETDPDAWLEDIQFLILENGYILSDNRCPTDYCNDIVEALSDIYNEMMTDCYRILENALNSPINVSVPTGIYDWRDNNSILSTSYYGYKSYINNTSACWEYYDYQSNTSSATATNKISC